VLRLPGKREPAGYDFRVEPAGLPANDFSSPLGPQSRGLRQKPCTTRSGRIRALIHHPEPDAVLLRHRIRERGNSVA
jgi:hypothetical protein